MTIENGIKGEAVGEIGVSMWYVCIPHSEKKTGFSDFYDHHNYDLRERHFWV